jgi:aspartate 1-decarboxylase
LSCPRLKKGPAGVIVNDSGRLVRGDQRQGCRPGYGRFHVQRFMLKSKIHRATLTWTELDYEGSIAIDRTLLEAADMLPGEQVHVLNLSNAARLVTYIIVAEAGSGTVMLNGPAARLGVPGDLLVILSFAACSDEEARRLKPRVVSVDARNRLVS